MREEIVAHIGLYLGTHNVTNGGHIVVCRSIYYSERYVKNTALKYQINGEACDILGGSAGDFTHDHREHKLTNGSESGAEKVAYHNRHMPLVIGQEFQQKPLLLFVFFHFSLQNINY